MSVTLFSCQKETEVTMNFHHSVAGADFEMNERNYLSPVGHNYEITKMLYYVSEITFFSADGSETTNIPGAKLIDLSNESSLSFALPVEAGVYSRVEFQFGIDKEHNVESYLESTVENQNMFWPVQMEAAGEKGDYHYMKYEGRYDSLNTGVVKPFIFHAGPTNGADNSFTVSIDLGQEMNTRKNSYSLQIEADLQEWIQNPTDYDFKDYSMVMMNQATQEIYKANGQSVFSLDFLVADE